MRKIKIAIIGLGHVHTQSLYRAFNQYADEIEWLGMADMENCPPDETARHIELNAGEAKELRLAGHYADLLNEHPDLVLCGSGIRAYFATLSPAFRQLVVDRFLYGV